MGNAPERIPSTNDLEAIRRLKHYFYCHCLDRGIAGDGEAFDHLKSRLSKSVVADFTGFPLAEGAEAVGAFLTTIVPSVLAYAQHRVMNDVIEVDGDQAKGLWYVDCPVVFREGNTLGFKGSGLIMGRYEEAYQREEGVWKWSRIGAMLDVVNDMDMPWAKAELNRTNR
ncbi:MAG: nuclear transport factor 2 family protein [Pseudomonadota bacterium]